MGFRENLLQKIRIDELSATVKRSLGAPGSGNRADLEAMRRLIELGNFNYRRERDLDLYLMEEIDGKPQILVLDNELKIYTTTTEDIALRKSPTVKEMVSIRNAIKILNDKDVVLTRKAETIDRIQQTLIADLDLSHTAADIEALAEDGGQALENKYLDGLTEIIDLFAELLDFKKAPKAFQAAHHMIWGHKSRKNGDGIVMGPVVLLNLMKISLKMIQTPVNSRDKAAMAKYHQVIKGENRADVTGPEVFAALKDAVMRQAS